MVGPEALHIRNEISCLGQVETIGKGKETQLTLFPSVSSPERDLRLKLDVVKEAKALFGGAFAQSVWVELGLPGGPVKDSAPPDGGGSSEAEVIKRFIRDNVLEDIASREKSSALYDVYCRWSAEQKSPIMTQCMFGRHLARSAGLRRVKCQVNYYLGIRLHYLGTRLR
ncbi:hypothetical protein ASD00_35160 [Ensifer sp. Root31]|uniref:hypothetical protein n=1 Tax=Ensifer sp. Root31 TaxID=1736512 RepID=UPI00070F4F91|nr:hypothetical protein [Ensifer sp. Root31]KQU81276.1 hypothetical protein ASD00_35160 [Ensifer sp. Root31]